MKRLNLSEWANIGDMVATIAVVVSLVFVIQSIDLNTRMTQASNDNFIYGVMDNIHAQTSGNSDLALIFTKVNADEELTDDEMLRWQSHLGRIMNMWELAFTRYHEGLMAEHTWETWNRSATGTFLQFVPLEFWEQNFKPYSNPNFREHVDEIIENQ